MLRYRHRLLLNSLQRLLPNHSGRWCGLLESDAFGEATVLVPCQVTVTAQIDTVYMAVKEQVLRVVAQQQHVTLTSDTWTSCAGNGYISLTCHCVTSEFEMYHKNLLTRHLYLACMTMSTSVKFCKKVLEWGIDLQHQVYALTTVNGSNIVKSVEDLDKLRIPCFKSLSAGSTESESAVNAASARLLGRETEMAATSSGFGI